MLFVREENRNNVAVQLLLLVVSLFISIHGYASHEAECSSQWYVTGYFTPIEEDYPQSDKTIITVEKLGDSEHASEFLKTVMIEGWGKTRAGWYLGRFANKWHRSEHPLNALGKPLSTGSIATDSKVIPAGAILRIPSLPHTLKDQLYVSDDVGSAIKNMHIDVYTGEGKQAEKTTFEITGKDHTVCRVISI